MNLFVTDPCPVVCATNLDDKRIVNQLRETGQLLCTALIEWGCADPRLMKPTHRNHPVTLWVGHSFGNWLWTLDHFSAMAEEKLKRWPSNPQHKNFVELSPILIGLARKHAPSCHRERTPFQNSARNDSLGLDYSSTENVHRAYRFYMLSRWATDKRPPRWTNSTPPAWAQAEAVAA